MPTTVDQSQMRAVPEADVRSLLELVSEASSLRDLDEFRTDVLAGLRRLVACESATYHEVDFRTQRVISVADPPGSAVQGGDEMLAEMGCEQAWMKHRIELLTKTSAPMGVGYQIAFVLPADASLMLGYAFNRARLDFSARDRDVLNLARPHLTQAYRNVAAYAELRDQLEALGRGADAGAGSVIVLGPDDVVAFATEEARSAVRAQLGRKLGNRLPEEVAEWVNERRTRVAGAPAAPAGEPLVIGDDGDRRLLVRLLPGRSPSESDVLMLEKRSELLPARALQGLGLTSREAEVLRLVALGATSDQAAVDLNVTCRTVEKHLENVYDKLSVSNRSAAIAIAWSGLGPSDDRKPGIRSKRRSGIAASALTVFVGWGDLISAAADLAA